VVGHSAACTLAWLAANARPEKVAKVALIGGFPSADGERYADFFEPKDGVMAFPGWARSRGRTPLTSTRRPGAGSRLPRSASPKG
jgi:pimeloyl-ACP methyl ester carboxylesterase